MKITCDNCGAKYSIADEKVQGKVFKIRCKKCSNIIVVRGTNDENDIAAGDAGGGADADDGWHVVIGREQTGPMGAAEIRERFAAGEINADSYVWREGFADWQRLAAVPAFSDLGESAAAPPVAESAPVAAASAAAQPDLFAGADDAGGEETNRTDAGSLFGTDAPAAGGGQDLFAAQGGDPAPEPESGGGGLFTSTPDDAAAAGGGGDLFGGVDIPSDPNVPVSDDAHMTGQRGENSVLFSLANLQALAMGGKNTVAESGPAPSAAPAAAGTASGGGSGLIDIRAMAASTGASTASSHKDELPALGGFASPIAAAPVLLPTASEERPKWVLPAVIGMGSLLAVTVVVLLVVLVGGDDKKDQPQMAQNLTTPKAAGEEPTKDEPAGTASTKKADEPATPTKGDETKGATAAETKPGEASTSPKGRRSSRKRRSSKRGKRTARSSSPAPTRASSPAPTRKRKPSGKRDELDDLIDGAISKKKRRSAPTRRATPAASSNSNLPERLERSQIQAGMRRVNGRVKGCYDRFKVPGLANVRVTISGSGKVSRARVSGLFAGTPTGSCVASAVKSARFPRCKKATTITYPFMLR